MLQILHGRATTTEAVRRAIQHSQESLKVLAGRLGLSPALKRHSTSLIGVLRRRAPLQAGSESLEI
jgi:hypothetical protein